MSGNRKVTDFFRPSASQRGRGRHEEDTIQVAQPRLASTPSSKVEDNLGAQQAARQLVSPPSLKPSGNDARRVALQRKAVIKSSDDEGDSSDSSLENLDDLLQISKQPGGSRQKDGMGQLASPALITPKYEFSLGSLLDQTEKDAAAEAGILEARAALALPDPIADNPTESTKTPNLGVESASHKDGEEAGEELLASVVKEQGGQRELQKIMHAMNRTEALNRPKAWYFFKEGSTNVTREVRECPEEGIRSARWQEMLRG